MNKVEHSELYLTTYDDLKLYGQLWQPEDQTKAVILLSHGLSDRSERFVHWAEMFASTGYSFCCYDTRGNGKSEGKRGHCNTFEDFLLDIDLCLADVKNRFPDVPVILYGHSMGGNVMSNYLLTRHPEVAAAIITSPWLRLVKKPGPLLEILARLIYRVLPSLDQKADIIANHLTDNSAVVQNYIDDPLIHDRITPAGYINISRAGEWAIDNAHSLHVPALLMQEKGDRITSFEATVEFAHKAGNRVHFKAWNGMFHELHNEPFREEVFKYILTWMDKELKR